LAMAQEEPEQPDPAPTEAVRGLVYNTEMPDKGDSLELNNIINKKLKQYDGRTRTLWLFLLAHQYYIELDEEDQFDITDYQMAAEYVYNQLSE